MQLSSLLEVGQVEELEAPVASDAAVDEDHVVDCGRGLSATSPAHTNHQAPPRPPGPAPGPRTSRDQQQESRHEEQGAGDTCRRRAEGHQGRPRAGIGSSPEGTVTGARVGTRPVSISFGARSDCTVGRRFLLCMQQATGVLSLHPIAPTPAPPGVIPECKCNPEHYRVRPSTLLPPRTKTKYGSGLGAHLGWGSPAVPRRSGSALHTEGK